MLAKRSIGASAPRWLSNAHLLRGPARALGGGGGGDGVGGGDGYNRVQNVHVNKTPITSQLWSMRQAALAADGTFSGEPPALAGAAGAAGLAAVPKAGHKFPAESAVRYHFRGDTSLRDQYVDVGGSVSLGRLCEDLDSMAGNIALLHCCGAAAGAEAEAVRPSLVTASVDYIKMLPSSQVRGGDAGGAAALSVAHDYVLRGHVVWVGRSSLDVLVELHRAEAGAGGRGPVLVSSLFTYVAQHPDTRRAFAIPYLLQPATDLQQAVFDRREALAQRRKQQRAARGAPASAADVEAAEQARRLQQQMVERGRSLLDMPALTLSESSGRGAPCRSVLVSQTVLENCFVTQPQDVNTAGKVFGGLLMRRAVDLAVACGYTFAGCVPSFSEVEEIAFRRPVEVGDLVRMPSRVVFAGVVLVPSSAGAGAGAGPHDVHGTRGVPTVQVEVTCQIMRPEQASSVVSNTFDFVFTLPRGSDLAAVLPATAEEAAVCVAAMKARTEC